MTIGIAIVIAMVLFLIDRNKVWKQAAKIVGVLILLAVLGIAGVVGWVKYDSWQTERKEAAAKGILDQERATFNSWYDRLKDCKRVLTSDTSSGKAFVFGKNFVVNGIDMLKIKRDIKSETVFVSPEDNAAGKAWDSMEAVQPCKGVWAAPAAETPVTQTFSQVRPLERERNYAWSTTAVTLTSQAVNEGMLVGKIAANERVEILEDAPWGVKVRTKNGVVGWVYPPSDLTKIAH